MFREESIHYRAITDRVTCIILLHVSTHDDLRFFRTALFWVLTQRIVCNFLPTFRDYISVPYSRVKKIGCTEKSVRNYHCSLRNNPEEPKITHLGFFLVGSNTIKFSLP
jgi:hypothetical protein